MIKPEPKYKIGEVCVWIRDKVNKTPLYEPQIVKIHNRHFVKKQWKYLVHRPRFSKVTFELFECFIRPIKIKGAK